ncbi:MAG: hypothetical protein ACYSU7_02755 [Planctomycetota bacterium]|jgi:hypothetical protein
MTASRAITTLLGPLLLLAPSAFGSEITVEWVGDFGIPDIIDPPGVFIDVEVTPDPAGMNIIEDLDLGLIIATTWQGDLIISLEHLESGRFHRLLDRPGNYPGSVYGFSADNYGILATSERFVLDDEALNPYDRPYVESPGIPDVTGHWQPDTDPLSSFDGDSIVGTWRLWFADQGGGDLAFVRNIALDFQTIPAPAAAAPLVWWLIRPRRRYGGGTQTDRSPLSES